MEQPAVADNPAASPVDIRGASPVEGTREGHPVAVDKDNSAGAVAATLAGKEVEADRGRAAEVDRGRAVAQVVVEAAVAGPVARVAAQYAFAPFVHFRQQGVAGPADWAGGRVGLGRGFRVAGSGPDWEAAS